MSVSAAIQDTYVGKFPGNAQSSMIVAILYRHKLPTRAVERRFLGQSPYLNTIILPEEVLDQGFKVLESTIPLIEGLRYARCHV